MSFYIPSTIHVNSIKEVLTNQVKGSVEKDLIIRLINTAYEVIAETFYRHYHNLDGVELRSKMSEFKEDISKENRFVKLNNIKEFSNALACMDYQLEVYTITRYRDLTEFELISCEYLTNKNKEFKESSEKSKIQNFRDFWELTERNLVEE